MEKYFTWYQKRTNRQKNLIYFWVFTMVFFFLFFGANIILSSAGKSFVVRDDSIAIYYETLMHRKRIFQDFISNLVLNHTFKIPWVNYNLTGDNNLFTIMGHEIFDIIYWFVPKPYFEYVYGIVIILRLWCAGIAFSLYCFYMKNKKFYTLLGSIVYCYCGYAMISAYNQPFFISLFYIIPLLFIGVEKLLKEQRGGILIWTVTIAALISVFLFYYHAIVLVLYSLVRIISRDKKIIVMIRELFSIGAHCLIGIGLSAFLFLPTAIGILDSGRVGGVTSEFHYFTYGSSHMLHFIKNFFIGSLDGRYYSHLGFSMLAFFPLIYLLTTKSKHGKLKISFYLVILLMNIPAFGYLAGAGTINNRWSYYLGFVVAYIVVKVMPELASVERSTYRRLNIISVLYGVILTRLYFKYKEIVIATEIFLLILAMAIMNLIWKKLAGRCMRILLLGLGALSIMVNGICIQKGKFAEKFIDKDQVNNELEYYVDATSQDIADNTFYRIEKYKFEDELSCNLPYWYGYNGVSSFSNVVNPHALDYYRALENPGLIQSNKASDLDGRTTDMALASVKYFLSSKKENGMAPYGFEPYKSYSENEEYEIYVNTMPLPLGYTYGDAISIEQFEALDIAQKQEIMLKEIVLEEQQAKKQLTELRSVRLDYNVLTLHQVEKRETGYYVTGKDAFIELETEIPGNNELYLQLDEVENMGERSATITLQSPNGENSAISYSATYQRPNGQKNFALNMGYMPEGSVRLKICFSGSQAVSIDSINVYARNLSSYKNDVKKLSEESLENIVLSTNKVKGDITVKDKKWLCFSLPYSNGWSCYVDGTETEIRRANIMYMAVRIPEGRHHIELFYMPPGMKLGIYISIGSLLGFISILIGHKFRNTFGRY